VRIEHLGIDGQGRAAAGVRLHKCQNATLEGVLVRRCGRGFLVDGTAAAKRGRVLELLLTNCISTANSEYGYLVEAPSVVAGSFSNVTLNHCASEGDRVACRIRGSSYIHRIASSEFQNSTGNGVEIHSARVSINDTYIELAPHSSGKTIVAVTHSSVLLQNSYAQDATADATSTIHVYNSVVNGLGFLATPSRIGRTTDDSGWGPPNDPPIKRGSIYAKGIGYTDRYGTEWTCTKPGVSGEAAFVARGGRIIRPLDFRDLVDGRVLWFPHEDMVVERVSLVINRTFVGSTATHLALSSSLRGDVLSSEQGAATNLLGGRVLVASANRSPSARLAPPGSAFLLRGSVPAAPRVDMVTLHTDGAWTAGEGLLVIGGYFLALG
jgi:hypothetical protein